MNIFSALVCYMIIGGCMVGLAFDAAVEDCGKPLELNDSAMMLGIVAWPGIIASSIFIDKEDYVSHKCD